MMRNARGMLTTVTWQRGLAIGLALIALLAAGTAWVGSATLSLTEPVVVTTRDIAPGDRITPAMVTLVQAPRNRPEGLRGLPDPRMVTGMFARVPILAGHLIAADQVQATPLDEAVFWDAASPAPQVLRGVVFELARDGIGAARPGMRVNIIALVDAERGSDPSFAVGGFDTPGRGARAVRVVRNAPVLEVDQRAVRIELTAEQSRFLWALAAAKVPFVGEVSADPHAPLGPLRPQDLARRAAVEEPVRPVPPASPVFPPEGGAE